MNHNDTAIVMYYWNHFKRASLFKNFNVCYSNLLKYKCHIVPVEISTNDTFDLNMPGTVKFRTDQLLWQKERVINYVCERLPQTYKYIVFCDSDILFTDDEWVEKAKNKLEDKQDLMLQLFSSVYYLPRNHYKYHGYCVFTNPSISYQIVKSGGKQGYINTFNSPEYLYGNPGMVWMCKRETLLNNPLYDKCVVGGGDTVNIISWLNLQNDKNIPIGKKILDDIQPFLKETLKLNKSNIEFDYIDQPIFHLNHGNKVNRKYNDRQKIISEFNLNPEQDLYIEQGLYRYRGENKEFLLSIKNFFKERNEDIE